MPNERESRPQKSLVTKENEQLLNNVKPQEVNSLVPTPWSDDPVSGNRLRECLQKFRNTGERIPSYKSLKKSKLQKFALIRHSSKKVSIGMYKNGCRRR